MTSKEEEDENVPYLTRARKRELLRERNESSSVAEASTSSQLAADETEGNFSTGHRTGGMGLRQENSHSSSGSRRELGSSQIPSGSLES